jgi:hypothetical protein
MINLINEKKGGSKVSERFHFRFKRKIWLDKPTIDILAPRIKLYGTLIFLALRSLGYLLGLIHDMDHVFDIPPIMMRNWLFLLIITQIANISTRTPNSRINI